MSPAEIIEREIVRPIFLRVNFKGRRGPIFHLASKVHRVLCGDAMRTTLRF